MQYAVYEINQFFLFASLSHFIDISYYIFLYRDPNLIYVDNPFSELSNWFIISNCKNKLVLKN